MKKNMKNCACLLAVFTLVSGMAGCGSETETVIPTDTKPEVESDSNVEPAETEYIDTLEAKDMGGYTYRIVAQHIESRPNFAFSEEMTGEPLNDGIHYRDTALKERLNINLEQIAYEDRGLLAKDVAKTILAQDDAYDLIITAFSDGINTLASQNLLLDLTTIPYLSLDSQYWNKSIAENMRFNGKQFFTSGPTSLSYFYVSTHMLVNRTLASSLDLPDLQQIVFDGKWTIDMMASLMTDVATDLNGDGKMKLSDDRFAGILGHTLGNEMYTAAGFHGVSYDGDKGWTIHISDQNSVDFIQKCAALFSDKNSSPNYGATNETHFEVFAEGRCLFIDSTLGNTIGYVRTNMTEDFGILPIPVLNEGDPYLCECNTWGPAGIAVPITVKDTESLGLIMETMAVYSYDYLIPAVVEKTLGKVSNTSADYQILTMTFNNGVFDLNTIMDFGGSSILLRGACFGSPKDFVSGYAKIEEKTQKALDDFIAAVEND